VSRHIKKSPDFIRAFSMLVGEEIPEPLCEKLTLFVITAGRLMAKNIAPT
jgi:hypothetical protein